MKWRWLMGLAVFLAIVAMAMAWAAGNVMVRSTPSAVRPALSPARDLKIASADGVLLAATYWPGRTQDAAGILLLHGNGGSRAMMAENAAWLANQGYAVLIFDFRGHGESTTATHSFGLRESADAAAAFAWLKRAQRGAPIGVIGVSLGGAAALLGENGPLAADALVLQAVYPDIRRAIRNRVAAQAGPPIAWLLEPLLSLQAFPRYGVGPDRIAPKAALRRYSGPVLVIGGGSDRYTPPEETREMAAAVPGQHAMWIVDGLDHGQVSGLANDAYRKRILAFFHTTLGSP